MTTDPRPAVVPMLDYVDGPAALDWLVRVFGFTELTRRLDADGRLVHGELDAFGGLLMLTASDPAYESPKAHREHCTSSAAWQQTPFVVNGVLVHVPDVDAHVDVARREGARILTGPEGGRPGRMYRAEDLEGHRWLFLEETP